MPASLPSSSRSAAVFTNRFLPYSQTFIYDEIRAHERYTIEVFCKQRMNADRFPYGPIRMPESWVATRVYENVRYWPPFDRALSRGGHALVHAHFGHAAMHAAPVAFRNDLPLIITFWGNDVSVLLGPQRLQFKNWDYALFMPKIMQRAARLLCVSQDMCEHVRRLSGRPDAVRWWRPGIDLDRYHPKASSNDPPEIIMVARFTEKKGHRYALRAFARALRAGREARLTLVGTGELEASCRQFVQDQGLAPHVQFAGVLPPSDVARRVQRADIALVPSVVAQNEDREGSPTVAKEASACGLPVLGTDHAGIPEIVEDGTTGLLVPERDVASLTEALIQLLDQPDLRACMGRAGREKMEREFCLADRVEALERHYDEVS
jgi:glycosyltransferase involved in cell wall biosynthesis